MAASFAMVSAGCGEVRPRIVLQRTQSTSNQVRKLAKKPSKTACFAVE
jgi:hypothetical protein